MVKMKVAILVPNFSGFSGDARVVKEQATTLLKRGHDVTIFTLSSNLTANEARIVSIGMPKSLFWQRVYRLLFPLDLIKVFYWFPKLKEYDEVISHLYPMNWLAFLAKATYGIKYTYWYHGIPHPSLYSSFIERSYLRAFICFTKISISNADRIVAVSNYANDELKSHTGLQGEVIYNRPDPEKFRLGIDGSEIRTKHNLDGRPVLLTVGRVCPLKGMHVLLEIVNRVKITFPAATLVVVGEIVDKQYAYDIQQNANGSVIFVGYLSHKDLPKYYAMCDIYVTASRVETYDLPLVEAQMCGRPAVAFDVGSHREVIEDDRQLVENGNVETFANVCIQILQHKDG